MNNRRPVMTTHPINLETPILTKNSILKEPLIEDKFKGTPIIETEKEPSNTNTNISLMNNEIEPVKKLNPEIVTKTEIEKMTTKTPTETSVKAVKSYNSDLIQFKNNNSTQPFEIVPGNIITTNQENRTLIENSLKFNRIQSKNLTENIITSNTNSTLLCKKTELFTPKGLEKTKMNGNLQRENNNNKNSAIRTRPNDIKKHLWDKRYLLFSKFDEGIMMDNESFYSVCPEILSTHIALRCPGLHVAMDPFCGAGGNVIQLAKRYKQVIAVDNDANKLEFAKRNAEIYGVREKITFILGDFFEIAESLKKYKPQVIVTSPPWGGPSYKKHKIYSLEKHMCSNYEGGGKKLFDLLRSIAPNVALHIPKTTGRNELIQFGKLFDLNMEIQHNYIDNRHDSITAFFGRFFNMNTKYLSNDNKLYTNKKFLKYPESADYYYC
ncbi:trimethylguanosine synthase-like [Daktulosphaira vitifoliae]|uniref:trimethylguanosine synthase-like n=1 Tax=Daktulosphaira vitifoliae TaxID=58002 RepID=UPI0021AACF97|nr:trimethylguanosine synthase-like [Daktulosphaira vitifoliae]